MVAGGANPFAGHVPEAPLQVSATSHTSTSARHVVPLPTSTSAGQLEAVPVQTSATSQLPVAARQVTPPPASTSAGQAAVEPSHVSGTSQRPAAARHVLPASARVSDGQAALEPVHSSAGSQPPALARQTVLAELFVQVPTVPARLHESHAPPQPVLQQTPSTQLPELHWEDDMQAVPFASVAVQPPALQ